MNDAEILTTLDLERALDVPESSEEFYFQESRGNKIYYTEGFKNMLTITNSGWLLTEYICLEVFQVWFSTPNNNSSTFVFRIKRNVDNSLYMCLLNGDLEVIWEEALDYSDFPEGDYEFYIGVYNAKKDVMLCYLKSEY